MPAPSSSTAALKGKPSLNLIPHGSIIFKGPFRADKLPKARIYLSNAQSQEVIYQLKCSEKDLLCVVPAKGKVKAGTTGMIEVYLQKLMPIAPGLKPPQESVVLYTRFNDGTYDQSDPKTFTKTNIPIHYENIDISSPMSWSKNVIPTQVATPKNIPENVDENAKKIILVPDEKEKKKESTEERPQLREELRESNEIGLMRRTSVPVVCLIMSAVMGILAGAIRATTSEI